MTRRSHFTRGTHRCSRSFPLAAAVVATITLASTAAAHDYWLIPDMFAVGSNATMHINGRQGTRFAEGRAIETTRVVVARIIGASSDAKITDMTVEGTALRMHHKPIASGQYLVVAGFTPRTFRAPPDGVIRFLRAESGASEAARLEREQTLAGIDTVVYTAASYAATLVQVGAAGPRAFSKTAGFPLEFVPLDDPAHFHVGDTLHVKVLGGGKPVPHIGIDAMPARDSAESPGAAPNPLLMTLSADANGVVHVPLAKAGPWMLRSAYASRKVGGAASEWDVSRTSYVFNVGAKQ